MKTILFIVGIICLIVILITTTLSIIQLKKDKEKGMLIFSINSLFVSLLSISFTIVVLLLLR